MSMLGWDATPSTFPAEPYSVLRATAPAVGEAALEACAEVVAVAVLERAVLAWVWGGRLCVPEVWGGDGTSGGGASTGEASGTLPQCWYIWPRERGAVQGGRAPGVGSGLQLG